MAVHHAHGHGSTTTVVDDREGPAVALIVLIALLVVGALIWFFAFSGVVFDRDTGGGGDVNIQQDAPDAPPAQNAPDVTQNQTDTEPAPTGT